MNAADSDNHGPDGNPDMGPGSRAYPELTKQHAYRPEVDGLRAVAVIPVILFHAGLSAFGGGYVGVDVFFVISGYLITSIILRERLSGTFSLASFYERRARRIMPALLVVMAACIPFAWVWMLPNELADFGKSLIAVCTFVSNVLFWRTSGYFDGATELKPLLHTWSLGIEEQYYVVFPLVVGWLFWLGIRRLFFLVAAAALISFAVSLWLGSYDVTANFYLLPSRAWELLAGSLLAWWGVAGFPSPRGRRLRSALSIVGMIAIALPVFFYDETTPFPGVAALPPVLGTVLVLLCTDEDSVVGRLLTLRPLLWIGAISYSAYLWHQPLFAYARLISPGEPPAWLYLTLAGLTLVLAHLSWKYVEAPFRDRGRFTRSRIFLMTAAGSTIMIAVGAAAVATGGFPGRFTPETQRLLSPAKTEIDVCPEVAPGVHACTLGRSDQAPSVALVGDSHATAIATELSRQLAASNRAGVLLYVDCHPIPGILDSRERTDPDRVDDCARASRILHERATAPSIKGVIIAVRWTLRLYPLGDEVGGPAFDNGEGGIELDAPYRQNLTASADGSLTSDEAPKVRAVQAFIRSFAETKTTVLLYPVPEVGWLPARLNLQAVATGRDPPGSISTSWSEFRTRNAAAQRILDGVELSDLRRSKPERRFCNTQIPGRCVVQSEGVLYYADDDHVSSVGAGLIVADVLAQLAIR